MALETFPDPLDRAKQVARTEHPAAWSAVSSSVMTQVKTIVTPAQPLLTFGPEGAISRDEHHSRTLVSTRVVSGRLRRRLQRSTHAPGRIELTADRERLTAVEVHLVGSYGADLRAVGTRARSDVHTEIVSLLGVDPHFGPDQITIRFVDVVEGDATLT